MATALEQFGNVLGGRIVHYREEPFRLRAGGESHWYIDGREAFGDPRLRTPVVQHLLRLTADVDYEMVAGIGVGGRAAAIGMMLLGRSIRGRELQGVWANDSRSAAPAAPDIPDPREPGQQDGTVDPKNGYGFSPTRVANHTVLAADDTLTTGDSLGTLVGMLRESGAVVTDAAVVVDRCNGTGPEVARQLGVTIHRLFEFQEESGLLVPAPGPYTPTPAGQ